MARKSFKVTVGANLGEGTYTLQSGSARDAAADLAIVTAAVVTAKASTVAAKASATTAKASTATAKTDATTADTNLATVVGADQTAVQSAIDTLVADGVVPTQAHVNALVTVWNTLKTHAATAKANTVTSKASATTADTDAGTAKTDATTADTNVGLVDTSFVATALASDFFSSWDTTKVPGYNALRRCLDAVLLLGRSSGME